MRTNTLWETLSPKKENIEFIKKDLRGGIAPHLPYFIIGLQNAKGKLESYLKKIDKNFNFCLIKGQYGNGKTNLLKYLEYYFECNSDLNVKCNVWRVDVDKYDLNLFLLYIIQQLYGDELLTFFKETNEEQLAKACNNFANSFSVLKEYTRVIYENKDNEENLKNLIKLGTGALYDKRSFDHFRLEKFTDYNRHEVLAFFLNIFAMNQFYILFCIDEIEKIQEKSKPRFQSFLTSFRELIDLSGLIKGHMIIGAVTDAGPNNTPIEAVNPAFGRRIQDKIVELESISTIDEIKALAAALKEILRENIEDDRIDIVASTVKKKNLAHTNEILIELYKQFDQNEEKSWRDIVNDNNLSDVLEEQIQSLKDEDVETRLNSKFFVPLENYLNIVSSDVNDYQIKVQQLQTVRKVISKECFIFLFTNDYVSNVSRIKNVSQIYPTDKIFVFKPEGLGFSHFDLSENENINNIKEVIVYNPIELMALITLFTDDYDNQDLSEALNIYLRGM